MNANLATILTDTAARHGARSAIKLDDFELEYRGSTRRPRASPVRCGRAACR